MQFHPLLRSLDGSLFQSFLLDFADRHREPETPEDRNNPDYLAFVRPQENTIDLSDFISQYVTFDYFTYITLF